MSSKQIVLPGASIKDKITQTYIPPPSPPCIVDNMERPLRMNANSDHSDHSDHSDLIDYELIYNDFINLIKNYNNIELETDYEIDGLKNIISQLNEKTIPIRIKNITSYSLDFYLYIIKNIIKYIDDNSVSRTLSTNPSPIFKVNVINIEMLNIYIYSICNGL